MTTETIHVLAAFGVIQTSSRIFAFQGEQSGEHVGVVGVADVGI